MQVHEQVQTYTVHEGAQHQKGGWVCPQSQMYNSMLSFERHINDQFWSSSRENKQRIKERVKEKRKSTSMLLTKQDPVGPIRRNSMNADTRELNNYELHRSLRGLHSSMITENPPPSSIAARRDTSEARKVHDFITSRNILYLSWRCARVVCMLLISWPRQ